MVKVTKRVQRLGLHVVFYQMEMKVFLYAVNGMIGKMSL